MSSSRHPDVSMFDYMNLSSYIKTRIIDSLNESLDDLFENVNFDQLNVSLWAGDAVLKNLTLKATALEDKSLPFHVVAGVLERLSVKIPWMSFNRYPIEVSLKELTILITPSTSFSYNKEVDERSERATKERVISRIEHVINKLRDNPKVEEEQGSLDRLMTKVAQNIHFKIESFHLRYEDENAESHLPFGAGIKFDTLAFLTTDSDWKPGFVSTVGSTFHKIGKLEGLGFYWNSGRYLLYLQNLSTIELVRKIKEFDKHVYVIDPIKTETRLRITPFPEKGLIPFLAPLLNFYCFIEEIKIGITTRQLLNLSQILEAISISNKRFAFRKFRPDQKLVKSYKGHYRKWWKFAYTSVVSNLKKGKMNFSWDVIRENALCVKQYRESYLKKLGLLGGGGETEEVKARLKECETFLTPFNIVKIRTECEIIKEKKEKSTSPDQGTTISDFMCCSPETLIRDGSSQFNVPYCHHLWNEGERLRLIRILETIENYKDLYCPHDYADFRINMEVGLFNLVLDDDCSPTFQIHVNNIDVKCAHRMIDKGLRIQFEIDGIEFFGRDDIKFINIEEIAGLMAFVTTPLKFAKCTGTIAKKNERDFKVKEDLVINKSLLGPNVSFKEEGHILLTELKKFKPNLEFDNYVWHALSDTPGQILLITNQRIISLHILNAVGGSAIDWEFTFEELEGNPYVIEYGIAFKIKGEEPSGFFKMFKSPVTQDRFFPMTNPIKCFKLLTKIEKAIKCKLQENDHQNINEEI